MEQDYTLVPRSNKQPDEVNFRALVELYGVVGSSTSTNSSYINGAGTMEPNNNEITNANGNNNKNRFEKESTKNRDLKLPDWVRKANRSILQDLNDHAWMMTTIRNPPIGWRHLHENRFGRALALDLGEGYSVQVHYLLAQ